jgi:hypothetical protein
MYRFLKIKDSLPWGLQKDGDDVFEHVMDLSTEDDKQKLIRKSEHCTQHILKKNMILI